MPGERNGGMKKLALAIIVAWVSLEACAAREMVFPSLPDGVLPFPEVATNMALRVTAARTRCCASAGERWDTRQPPCAQN